MNPRCTNESKPGMILIDAMCKSCNCRHPQWKIPCPEANCEDGKYWIKGEFGYQICKTCKGRKYIDESRGNI